MTDAAYTDAPDASATEPGGARKWLDMITDAERYFDAYQEKADAIDKLYADLEKLSGAAREREMQMFWANLEVLKPSIYAQAPVPVVVPRFKDKKELPRKAAEMLERSLISTFSTEDIDATMRLIRDDLAVNARGVVWLRLDDEDESERVCFDHLERRDFLHEPARKWPEVGWVSRRSYLTRAQGKKRFTGEGLTAFLSAEFKQRDEDKNTPGGAEYKGEAKAVVWELWHRDENVCVWVAPGVDDVLDEQDPILTLEGFFPCPRPAYGTVQRRTLKPVPDFLQYKDQIEEINELTARISALSESLKMKGFYAAGASEIGVAVEAAIKATNNNAILIPISNFAALGGPALKDAIVWLPVTEVATVVETLVELRKQLIDDVYQVTGLSDIMRGSTVASETLGAQKLKSQYGSVRIRDKQAELVRVARDISRMAAEIMAENFSPKTLLSLSQMNDLPTDADIRKHIQQITGQQAKIGQALEQAQRNPQLMQQAQQNPDQAKQIVAKAQQALQQLDQQKMGLGQVPTVEKVVGLLREERVRPFVLDIETDSTIQPDEDAQKQRATEFVTAVGGFMGQALPLVQADPQVAPLVSEVLKYVASQFRAGRDLEGAIDQFADQMAQASQQPKPPSPEAQAAQLAAEKTKGDIAATQQTSQIQAAAEKRAQDTAAADEQRKQQAHANAQSLAERETAAKVNATNQSMAHAQEASAQAAQAHTQNIEKGKLDIAQKRIAVRQAALTPITGPDGEPVATGQGEGDAPDIGFDIDFEKKAAAALGEIANRETAIMAALKQIGSIIAAPVRVVKDAAGNPVGIERAGVVRPVTRDPQTGAVVGLQ